MLQQTTVATVGPYFERFIKAFPSAVDLAAADEQEVLRLWQGLGYYGRARRLHQAAKQLVERYGPDLPDVAEIWAGLPGVGRYILGAVLSQAFGRRLPIVEANSQRVLCRVFGQAGEVKSSAVQKWLWETAGALVSQSRPGDFNQAMMELGALVCTSSAPDCPHCPVRGECQAYADGTQEQIPHKGKTKRLTEVQEVAVVLRRGDRFFLARRSDAARRWAGLWEFPRGELKKGETHEQAAERLLAEHTGLSAEIGGEITTVHHGVTRFRIALTALEATPTGGEFVPGFYSRALWLPAAKLGDYPAATAQRRLAEAAGRTVRQRRLF